LQWSLDGLGGSVQPDGTYTAANEGKASAGKVKVKLGALTGEANVRVIPQRWEMTFEDLEIGSFPQWWVNARDKFAVKTIGGNKVLAKLANTGAHAFAGLHTSTNYTMEADMRFPADETMGNGRSPGLRTDAVSQRATAGAAVMAAGTEPGENRANFSQG
jgi:hypothetical protein